MLAECLVIAVIIAAMAIFYYRIKRDHAIAIIPLLILPLANVFAYLFSEKLSIWLPMGHFTSYCVVNLLGVIVSSFFVGLWSIRFKRKSTKFGYVIMSLFFNVSLAAVLIYNMYITLIVT